MIKPFNENSVLLKPVYEFTKPLVSNMFAGFLRGKISCHTVSKLCSYLNNITIVRVCMGNIQNKYFFLRIVLLGLI